jgi:hypothetical protein
MSASLKGYGIIQPRRLRLVITNWQLMKRLKLRICKETRLLGEQKTVLSGAQGCLELSRVAQVVQMKAKKILIGS